KIYINGAVNQSQARTGAIATTSYDVALGSNLQAGGRFLNGALDEVRVSNIARTADWVQSEYNNQFAPATFYAVGGAQTNGGTSITVTTAPAGLSVTVDGVGCTSPCNQSWTPGSNHTIAVSSPQAGGTGTQYVYS